MKLFSTRKITHILAISMLCTSIFLTSKVSAAPAYNNVLTVYQPGYGNITYTLNGNEVFNVKVTSDGYIIDKINNNWCYCKLDTTTNKIVSTSSKYKIDKVPSNALKNNESLKSIKEKVEESSLNLSEPKGSVSTKNSIGLKSMSLDSTLHSYIATNNISNMPLLPIMINFDEKSISSSKQGWYDKLFNSSAQSVDKFYLENSNNKFKFVPAMNSTDPNQAILSINLTGQAYPRKDTTSDQPTAQYNINQKVLQYINTNRTVDFSKLDKNSDGKLDETEVIFLFIYPGYEQSGGSTDNYSVWAHMYNFMNTTVGSYSVSSNYVNIAEYLKAGHTEAMGTIAHELGHTLGLPDMYDYVNYGSGLDSVSIMAGGSWGQDPTNSSDLQGDAPSDFDAWSKKYLGFITPIDITSSQYINLYSQNSGQYNEYKISTSNPKEYFLLENRNFTGSDKSLLNYPIDMSGVAIYHIDESKYGNGDNDNYNVQPLIKFVEADAGYLGKTLYDDRLYSGFTGTPFFTNMTSYTLNSYTNPRFITYGGTILPWNIKFNNTGAMSTNNSSSETATIDVNTNVPTKQISKIAFEKPNYILTVGNTALDMHQYKIIATYIDNTTEDITEKCMVDVPSTLNQGPNHRIYSTKNISTPVTITAKYMNGKYKATSQVTSNSTYTRSFSNLRFDKSNFNIPYNTYFSNYDDSAIKIIGTFTTRNSSNTVVDTNDEIMNYWISPTASTGPYLTVENSGSNNLIRYKAGLGSSTISLNNGSPNAVDAAFVTGYEPLTQQQFVRPANTVTTNSSYWTYTGVAKDSKIKEVYLNGIKQSFMNDGWRQFDYKFSLKDGKTIINTKVVLQSGQEIDIPITVIKNNSFVFSSKVGIDLTNAPVITSGTMSLTGLVKDTGVKYMKINGVPVSIKYAWRQFDSTLTLKSGLNVINVVGYTDANYTQALITEKFYIIKNPEGVKISNPKYFPMKSYYNKITITGLASDSRAKIVKINGVSQTFKYAWRQFDQPVYLKAGTNSIPMRVIYAEIINGTYYQYAIDKNLIVTY